MDCFLCCELLSDHECCVCVCVRIKCVCVFCCDVRFDVVRLGFDCVCLCVRVCCCNVCVVCDLACNAIWLGCCVVVVMLLCVRCWLTCLCYVGVF